MAKTSMKKFRKWLHDHIAEMASEGGFEVYEEIIEGLEAELEDVHRMAENAAWASVAEMEDGQKARFIERMSA